MQKEDISEKRKGTKCLDDGEMKPITHLNVKF